MAKFKSAKITALIMTVALLANTCLAAFTASAVEPVSTTDAAAVSETEVFLDNSILMPYYVSDDKVTLEVADNGVAQTPDWVKDLIIVEANVRTASTDGTFAGMSKFLAHLQEMGVNGVHLAPLHEGDENANFYCNYGPHTVSAEFTGTSDYTEGWNVVKAFVDEAHSRNIRVFFDVVTWGTDADSDLYTAHPDWYSGAELYGGKAFDWSNQELYDWFLSAVIEMITVTGADGIRADCGSKFTGSQFYKDIRSTLLANGRKIAVFSEGAETRDGTFDFEQHTVDGDNFNNTSILWTEIYNIVDAVKSGDGLGTTDMLTAGTGGLGRYYTSLISCHDNTEYGAVNDLLTLGYSAVFAPFIPVWYLGEEWNNTPNLSENHQLYRATIDWSLIDTNREYYESVKQMIRIRRYYNDIFSNFTQNHRNSNICKVTTSDEGLQAYARYADGKAVIIVPNNTDAAVSLDVTIPYTDAGLDTSAAYTVTDLMADSKVISGAASTLTTFKADLDAGELGVYIVEKQMTFTGASLAYNASYESEPHWVITLTADNNIDVTESVNYWLRNLQQIAAGATVEHNALAEVLRNNIFVNGISVDTALNAAEDKATAIHIKADGKNLVVAVDTDENIFGIDDKTDFTVELKNGITLGSYRAEAAAFTHLGSNNSFVSYKAPVTFTDASYADGYIVLTSDQNLEAQGEDVATAVGSNILVNDTAVTNVTVSGNQLKIAYESTADFTVYIKEGITLNGHTIPATRYNCTYMGGYTVQNGEYVTDIEGAATPHYVWTSAESEICSSHGGEQWKIDIYLDVSGVSSLGLESYWNRHLQAHATYGEMIRSNILLNGKTLDECIAGGDAYTAVHVAINESNVGSVISISVPKDNTYGFNAENGFTVTFLGGIDLGGTKINPRVITCAGLGEAKGSAIASYSFWQDVEPDASKATFTETALNVSANYEGTDPYWVFTLKADKEIGFGNNSYWYRNLQQVNSGAPDVHNVLAAVLRSKITINGITVDAGLYASKDQATGTRIKVGCTSEGTPEYLYIAVKKNDDPYGIDPNKGVTLGIASGITLGDALLEDGSVDGVELNPVYFTFVPPTVEFTVPEITANRVKTELTSTVTDFYVYFDKAFNASTSSNQAQNPSASTANYHIATALDICKYIRINGMTIGEGNILEGGNFSAMISLLGSGSAIRFHFNDANNLYGVKSGERFTVEFTEGFMLDGYRVVPKVATSDNVFSDGSKGGYWPVLGTFTNGAVQPRNQKGGWITNAQHLVAEGETFSAKVVPNSGYTLKAGSLTYTYWYKGNKIVRPITASADGSNYTVTCPGVVGQIDAQFVPSGSANFAVLGAHKRLETNDGLRFVTRMYTDGINMTDMTVTVNGTTYSIVDYGTLIGFAGTELTLDTAVKASCAVKAYEANAYYADFTAELINVSDDLLDTEFAAVGYLQYNDNGNVVTIYTDTVTRSVNSVNY